MKRECDRTGILVVDKPAGVTSHDVVDRVRRLFCTRRVGHTGTLDPDATGVLVLCVGQATRIAEYLSASSKHYAAEFLFGVVTDTLDASGRVLAEADASHLSAEAIADLLPAFRGRILQTPPMVSARRHEGKRLYELAREGVVVERVAREVVIESLELTGFVAGTRPRATFEITCSSGTYIRVLADEIGRAAGTGANMSMLRRSWVGRDCETGFTLSEAYTLDDLQSLSDSGQLDKALLTLAAGLRSMPHLTLSADDLPRLLHGHEISANDAAISRPTGYSGLAAVIDCQGVVCAIVQCSPETIRPLKVLTPA